MQKFEKRRGEPAGPPQSGPRERAFAIAMRRKEDFLGARVPKELKDRVIQRARELDLPVSLLIRKVLEDAFTLNATPDSDAQGAAVSAGRTALEKGLFKRVLGWKDLELNQNHPCDSCGTQLRSGTQAMMGILAGDEGFVVVCGHCKGQIQGRV